MRFNGPHRDAEFVMTSTATKILVEPLVTQSIAPRTHSAGHYNPPLVQHRFHLASHHRRHDKIYARAAPIQSPDLQKRILSYKTLTCGVVLNALTADRFTPTVPYRSRSIEQD
jgi:hypothetical protein